LWSEGDEGSGVPARQVLNAISEGVPLAMKLFGRGVGRGFDGVAFFDQGVEINHEVVVV